MTPRRVSATYHDPRAPKAGRWAFVIYTPGAVEVRRFPTEDRALTERARAERETRHA